jgi:phage shock protein E
MKKILMIACAALLLGLAACCTGKADSSVPKELSSDELAALIRKKPAGFVLVDVRSAAEYASGHIPTAVNIPVDTIATVFPAQDRSAMIVLYCQSGNRSRTAQKILEEQGFTNIVNFGGIAKWSGPLQQGTEAGSY